MQPTASISVYVQALGAHFLGAHAYEQQNITIQLNYSLGQIKIPYTLSNNANDGIPSATFTIGESSFMPIITIPQPAPTPPKATVNFLSANAETIVGKTNFTLPTKTELAQLVVHVPNPASTNPIVLQQSVLLVPTMSDYTITVVVPGLYLAPAAVPNAIAVYVRMMCGCPITLGPPASLWPASDFIVQANVLDIDGNTTPYTLTYETNQPNNSLFTAPVLATQKKIMSVTFTARQHTVGNYGMLVNPR